MLWEMIDSSIKPDDEDTVDAMIWSQILDGRLIDEYIELVNALSAMLSQIPLLSIVELDSGDGISVAWC